MTSSDMSHKDQLQADEEDILDVSQEDARRDEVVDDSHLEEEPDALSSVTPSSQDLLSASAPVDVVNSMSLIAKVAPVDPVPFCPLEDYPVFTIDNWAVEINRVYRKKEDKEQVSQESSQGTGYSLPPAKSSSPREVGSLEGV